MILSYCQREQKLLVAIGDLRPRGNQMAMWRGTMCLVAKGFKETFSRDSLKDPFKVIKALMTHFTFLNGDIDKTIIMEQPKNFMSKDLEHMVCKFKKSIYGLKQVSRQRYFKFYQVMFSFCFEIDLVDDCIYYKFCGSKCIFLILYVHDILVASNDTDLLHENF